MKDKIVDNKDLENKIIESSSNFEVPQNLTKAQAWEKLEQKISFAPKSRRIQITALKWAASISIILAISFFVLKNIGNENFVAENEIEDIELPDGSRVTLNQNSSISYNHIFWSINRNIFLKGQAYFDVEKGSAFTVFTQRGVVSVLGTEFNVIENRDKFEVFCFEGKVAVSIREDEKIKLSEGMATSLRNNSLSEPFTFNKEEIAAWKNGLFYFEKKSLNEVFEEIEANYKVNIVVNVPIQGKNFSGKFKKGDIKTVMEIVCSSMGLNYQIDKETVTVSE